ncbi:MAG TPA: hypothetical protein VFX01_05290 [Methylophilaceae bacterium]|nr:hypothetical protein [Methylophilaceae bacterium]
MSKRSILLLGLTGIVVGVIASELGRNLFRSRVDKALRDPRVKQPGYAKPLPNPAAVTADDEDLWVTPLHEETSHLAH